jgi:parallel beta-helix repeat protein
MKNRSFLGLLALAPVAACTPKEGDSGVTEPVDWSDCTTLLEPSADDQTVVQTALIEAAEGSTACFDAGTWHFSTEVSLSVDGVTLRGAGAAATIFDFSAQDVGGNGMAITGDGVTMRDFTVMDTPGDGIRATNVTDVAWSHVVVGWNAEASLSNGAYGFYPVGSDGVRIEDSEVYGARDAGLYVGQSTRILVARNEAHGNVAGIEIENSTDAEVTDNHAYDNTAGILVFNLPGLEVGDGKRANVHDNLVEANNRENFAAEGTIVSQVPSGLGFVVLATDANEFHDNTVTGHDTSGMVVLSYIAELFGEEDDPTYDIWPEANWTHDNVFSGNGEDPQGVLAGLITTRPMPDMLWDGCTDEAKDNSGGAFTNCWSDNGDADFFDFDWCGGFAHQSDDIGPYTCERTPLPSQDP